MVRIRVGLVVGLGLGLGVGLDASLLLIAGCHGTIPRDRATVAVAGYTSNFISICFVLRLRNDLYCVELGVKLYSLTLRWRSTFKLNDPSSSAHGPDFRKIL